MNAFEFKGKIFSKLTEDNNLLQVLNIKKESIEEKRDGRGRKKENSESTDRDLWSSRTEFLLSCIGYAVGLGNIWRFPYLCYRNGGGAFLIPYLMMLVFCGIPLYFVEMGIGQFAGVGCLGVFRMAPLLKGTGYAMMIVNFICACYCSVILSYPILFLQKILTKTLPWTTCSNPWNTAQCVEMHELKKYNFTNNTDLKLAADEFFHNGILQISTGIAEIGGIVWPLFWCLIISCFVLYLCIFKGIKSVGKVVYFSATFPFFVLIVLFIRGVTLPGAMDGIIFYIKPDWLRLLDVKVWIDAALQIFFSLGPGWGGLVNMASFNNFRNNIKNDVLIIPIINCSTSIFAGFVVFSVLGYLSHETGIPVESVATNGPGLVFITYPQAIALLPLPHLWAALFFLMLFLLGLDTVFVQLETVAASIIDEIPKLRKYNLAVPGVLCFAVFLASIILVTRGGMYIVNLLDWYSCSLTLICICIMETVMVAWIYGVNNFLKDITFMIRKKPAFLWKYCLKYITPLILIFLFFTTFIFHGNVTYNGVVYPDYAIAIGWFSCVASLICIPFYMIYVLISNDGSCVTSVKPMDWRPAKSVHRDDYESFQTLNYKIINRREN